MVSITNVKAWGLWSHYESTFDFSPGLTVITGPNGSGKSGLISIMRWVFLGEPSGEDFIFTLRDEKTQEVIKQSEEGKAEVTLSNGLVITKTRRKGKTTYKLNTVEEPYEKAEVPQEVKDALGIGVTKFGDWETVLNFAFQLEAPFLISESPSVGAKVLGKLAGTEVVDLAIGDIAKKTYKARDDLKIADKDIATANGSLLEYNDLDDLKAQLDACDFLIAELDNTASKRDAYSQMAVTYENSQGTIDQLKLELKPLETVEEAAQRLGEVESQYAKCAYYTDLTQNYGGLSRTIDQLTADLLAYGGVPEACEALTIVELASIRVGDYVALSEQYAQLSGTIVSLSVDLDAYKNLDVAAGNMEIIERSLATVERLVELEGSHRMGSVTIATLTEQLKKLETIAEATLQLASIEQVGDKLDKLQLLQREYNLRNVLANQAATDLTAAEEDHKNADAELTAAWEAAGGICPLCDQPVATHSHA